MSPMFGIGACLSACIGAKENHSNRALWEQRFKPGIKLPDNCIDFLLTAQIGHFLQRFLKTLQHGSMESLENDGNNSTIIELQ